MTADDKVNILLVDDQPARLLSYETILADLGQNLIQARSGLEALEKAFELRPDVILMDLSLPGLDGWAATRQLKTDDRTKDIPVVALTGHALAGASDGARQAGCDAFVTKPCLPDELVLEVKRVLERSQPEQTS